jgi:serine phosphatase RsbU (regulator of sigma subunit)
VLYTDGVTEARRGAAFFGEQRLHASVAARGTDPRTIVDGLLDDVATYEQGRNSDDVAILALRVPSV